MSISANIQSQPNLAGWLRLNPITWTLFGVPPAFAAGTYTIILSIFDQFGGLTYDDFKLKVSIQPLVNWANGVIPYN